MRMRTGSICSVGAYQICALSRLPPRRTASAAASGSAVVIGTVIDGIPGLIMTVLILLPVANEIYHIDPRHFGVVVVVNLVLGLMSPPVGLSFFVAAAVTGAKPGKMFLVTLPFFLICCAALVLLSLFPSLSLGLLD